MSTTGAANTHHDRLADFTRDIRILKLALMALVIGSITALIAYILVRLIALVTNLAFYQQFSFADSTPANATLGYWVILVPAIGGLIIGLMARYGSERIRGHGIPEAIEAILIGRSRMSPKVAVLKPLSSAISIGTGGPFGAEGPIIMTGGAFGSLFAQLFHLSAAERKALHSIAHARSWMSCGSRRRAASPTTPALRMRRLSGSTVCSGPARATITPARPGCSSLARGTRSRRGLGRSTSLMARRTSMSRPTRRRPRIPTPSIR